MAASVTAAPPMALPRVRADSWPSRVRSRMYSRSIPDSAASTVNTIPGRVVRAVQLAGQELQPDAAGLQLLGQRR